MVDRLFPDIGLAGLYDAFCPWDKNGDYDYYLELVMSSDAVLDVGCGTGALLTRAREIGHEGRLVGLDPAVGMLEHARKKRSDIEWLLGDLEAVAWQEEFDLVLMTGHAFQVFVSDPQVRTALVAVRSALRETGRFAFETRNPLVREWEQWTPENCSEVTCAGQLVRQTTEVDRPVKGDLVSFTLTFSSESWEHEETSRSTLRFLDEARLDGLLDEGGFVVADRFGDWDRSPFTEQSPEIITIARRRCHTWPAVAHRR